MVCPLLRKWELLGVLHILPPLFPLVPWNDGTPHPMTGPQPEATTLCSLLLEPSFSSRSRWTNVSPSHGASVSSVSEVFIAFGQRPAARCIRLLVQSSELEGISELGSSCIAEVVLTRTRKLRSGAPLPRGSWCIMSSLQSWCVKSPHYTECQVPFGFPQELSGKESTCSAGEETQVRSLGREDPLEEGMATYSSILAWRFPWTEEPGGLQSTGLQRVWHDWVCTYTHNSLLTKWIHRQGWQPCPNIHPQGGDWCDVRVTWPLPRLGKHTNLENSFF